MTTKERELWKKWINTPGGAPKEYAAFRAVEKRNLAQRARRASPEAKAKEAQASRRSYHRRVNGYGTCVGPCGVCDQMRKDHSL